MLKINPGLLFLIDMEGEKTKALGLCENCGTSVPVRISPDKSIESVGTGCGCETPSYQILDSEDLP